MGKGNKIRLHERSLENDIKYRGPFSYRHLRMFGWLFLVLAQIATILNVAARINPELDYGLITQVISTLSSLTVPLFLTANFSVILTSQKNYKPLLIKYAALMLGTTLLFFYVYEHIIGGVFRAYLGSDDLIFEQTASLMIPNGFIAFNIFLDLFLCSLFMFFLDFTPNKVFVGKKLVIFRLFAILPVVYEVVMIVLKIKAANRSIILSPFIFPLLTTKPPFCFLAFVFLGLNMMKTKRRYMKNGNTLEQYHDFLKTNANSLHFSIRMAIIFVVMAVLDFIVTVTLVIILSGGLGAADEALYPALNQVVGCGFGGSIVLFMLAPLVLLYSYNRKPESGLIDSAIPLLGVLGCVLVYVEGIYRLALLFASTNAETIQMLKYMFIMLMTQTG